MEREGWLDTKGGDNRITKYDLVDMLMERYPPDVTSLTQNAYSREQISKMLSYDNSANPADERCFRYFQLREEMTVDSFDLRMYLYGAE